MREYLYRSFKIEVRASPVHRYGVFAKEDILEEEILEECAYLPVTDTHDEELLKHVPPLTDGLRDYVFSIPEGIREKEGMYFKRNTSAVALGYGSLYNHSEEPNVEFIFDFAHDLFVFTATKRVSRDEELFISYGYGKDSAMLESFKNG